MKANWYCSKCGQKLTVSHGAPNFIGGKECDTRMGTVSVDLCPNGCDADHLYIVSKSQYKRIKKTLNWS